MTITFEQVDTIDDSILDSLISDSLEDIKSGTMLLPKEMITDEYKIDYIKLQDTFDKEGKHCILVKNNNIPIMYINGHIINNEFTWKYAFNGYVDGSRAVFRTSDFHNKFKEYMQQQNVTKYRVVCVKDGKVDVWFTRAEADNICLGTYEREYTEGSLSVVHTWEY